MKCAMRVLPGCHHAGVLLKKPVALLPARSALCCRRLRCLVPAARGKAAEAPAQPTKSPAVKPKPDSATSAAAAAPKARRKTSQKTSQKTAPAPAEATQESQTAAAKPRGRPTSQKTNIKAAAEAAAPPAAANTANTATAATHDAPTTRARRATSAATTSRGAAPTTSKAAPAATRSSATSSKEAPQPEGAATAAAPRARATRSSTSSKRGATASLMADGTELTLNKTSISKLTKVQLAEELERHGADTEGLKPALVDRLLVVLNAELAAQTDGDSGSTAAATAVQRDQAEAAAAQRAEEEAAYQQQVALFDAQRDESVTLQRLNGLIGTQQAVPLPAAAPARSAVDSHAAAVADLGRDLQQDAGDGEESAQGKYLLGQKSTELMSPGRPSNAECEDRLTVGSCAAAAPARSAVDSHAAAVADLGRDLQQDAGDGEESAQGKYLLGQKSTELMSPGRPSNAECEDRLTVGSCAPVAAQLLASAQAAEPELAANEALPYAALNGVKPPAIEAAVAAAVAPVAAAAAPAASAVDEAVAEEQQPGGKGVPAPAAATSVAGSQSAAALLASARSHLASAQTQLAKVKSGQSEMRSDVQQVAEELKVKDEVIASLQQQVAAVVEAPVGDADVAKVEAAAATEAVAAAEPPADVVPVEWASSDEQEVLPLAAVAAAVAPEQPQVLAADKPAVGAANGGINDPAVPVAERRADVATEAAATRTPPANSGSAVAGQQSDADSSSNFTLLGAGFAAAAAAAALMLLQHS